MVLEQPREQPREQPPQGGWSVERAAQQKFSAVGEKSGPRAGNYSHEQKCFSAHSFSLYRERDRAGKRDALALRPHADVDLQLGELRRARHAVDLAVGEDAPAALGAHALDRLVIRAQLTHSAPGWARVGMWRGTIDGEKQASIAFK